MLRTKLMLGFGLAGLALVTAPLIMYMMHSSRSMQAARREQLGIAPSKALLRVVALQQQHRGLSGGVLAGNTPMEARRRAKQTEVDKAVEAFDAMVKSDIRDPALAAAWRQAAEAWKELANAVSLRSLSLQESFARHTMLIDENLKLLDLILDHFGLSYDPSAETHHLIMGTLVHMPNMTELLGQARVRGTVHLTQKSITPVERFALIGLLGAIDRSQGYGERELGKAVALSPQMESELGDITQETQALARKAVDLARSQVAEAAMLSYSPADYFVMLTQAIDGQFTLLNKAIEGLEGALQARVAALRSEQIKTIGFIALVIALAVWLGIVIIRSLTGSVRGVVATMEKAAAGDLTARASVNSTDELGQIAAMLNQMLESLRRMDVVRKPAEEVR